MRSPIGCGEYIFRISLGVCDSDGVGESDAACVLSSGRVDYMLLRRQISVLSAVKTPKLQCPLSNVGGTVVLVEESCAALSSLERSPGKLCPQAAAVRRKEMSSREMLQKCFNES